MKKVFALLLIPMMFAFTGIVGSASSSFANEQYVSVKAGETEVNAFKNKMASVLEQHSLCDTTKEECDELINLYAALSSAEKAEVNKITYVEGGKTYTYQDAMKEVIRVYYAKQNDSGAPKQRLDQSTTIIIAVVVSIFGMSAISVLFILKKDQYIQ